MANSGNLKGPSKHLLIMWLTFDETRFDSELINYLKIHYHKFKKIRRTQTIILYDSIYAYYDVLTHDNKTFKYQVSKNRKNQYKIVTLI